MKQKNMKLLRTITVMLLWTAGMTNVQALPVDSATARKAAYQFIRTRPGGDGILQEDVRLAFTSTQIKEGQAVGFYAFSAGSHGFVLVAADDGIPPILAYSTTSALPLEELPAVTRELLEGYHDDILQQREKQAIQARPESRWEQLLEGRPPHVEKAAKAVDPLIRTTWNQSPYYNKLCPYDSAAGRLAVTGCVATAMAQVIRYWEWPKNGYGVCAYTHNKYGYLETDYSKAGYNFKKMPVELDKNSSNDEINAVAKLMSDCGIGVAMSYSPTGSGAWVIESAGGEYSAEYVMQRYYGYVLTEGTYRYLNPASWHKWVRNDLDNGRPLLFSATKPGTGGHAFICDGYDELGFYHFNWGWGGSSDGFYLMDSAYGFNTYQAAIFGLMPPNRLDNHHIVLYSHIIPSADTIRCDDAFDVRVTVQNNGNKPFLGEFRVVLQNSQTSENVAVFDTISFFGKPLAAETALSSPMVFRGKLNNLQSSNYNFRLQYRDTNAEEWLLVSEIGNYSNIRSIRFEGGSTSTGIDTVTEITATSATVQATVYSGCSETVTMKAIQYRKSGSGSFSTVKDTSAGDGILVKLDNLAPGTSYDIQSYVMVKVNGTFKSYTGEKCSFTTLQGDAIATTEKARVRIYPNPSHGMLYIESAFPARLEICNMLGQIIGVYTVQEGRTEIRLDQPKGLYLLNLTAGQEKITEKILIK